MSLAVRCPECGRVISTAPGGPAGGCPFCIAMMALNETGASPSTPGTAEPDEVLKAGASARLGKYVRVSKLGSGGMGDVWKAWDTELERWVALKLLRHDDPRELERFTREARTAAALSHPNIAAVYEAGQVGGKHYIAMQLVVGRTLDRWIRGEVRQVASMVRDAARAVGVAHKHGIVHRDLKPTNLMVVMEESGLRVVVMDFGLARRIEGGAKLSGTGTLAGTPSYMSPEQSRGLPSNARSDVYSLGVTLYELLTGRPPFESVDLYELVRKITDADPASPRLLDRKIDRDLDTIVLKCLEKDPARRYQTGESLARDLERWLTGEPILARPVGAITRITRKLGKRKALVAAAVSGAVVAVMLGWWALVGSPDSEHTRLYADAINLWAEVLRSAGSGEDPEGIPKRALTARAAFERAIQAQETALAYVMMGRCLQVEGRTEDALKALERAHALQPMNVDARLELAKVLFLKYHMSRGFPGCFITVGAKGAKVNFQIGTLPAETGEQRRLRERAETLLPQREATPAQKSLMTALLSMGKGLHPGAADAFETYWKEERWDTAALTFQGICRIYAKDLPGAVEALNRSLGRVPTPAGYDWRGFAKALTGHLDEALADCDQALRLNAKSPRVYLTRGIVNEAKGLFDEALADYHKAIELDPNNSLAYIYRGSLVNDGMRQPGRALPDFEKAVELDPKRATAYSNRGNAKSALGLLEEAIKDHDKAIELDPSYALAYSNRGSVKIRKGIHVEAMADLNRAIELDPNCHPAFSNRGALKIVLGRHDEATVDLNMAIELNPKSAMPFVSRGAIMLLEGRLDQAICEYDRAIALDPFAADAYSGRGLAKKAKGLIDEAIADQSKAIELNPNGADAYTSRGIAKAIKGLHEEAISDHTKAIKLDPNHANAYGNRGISRVALRLYEEAISDFNKALEVAPSDWRYRAMIEQRLRTVESLNRRGSEK